MATPHVTGAAALLLSHEPGMTHQELKEKLLSGGDPIPSLEGKTISGVRLNLNNSIRS
jgi:subtilisin family serine protease